jgi:hypothetical protein
MCAGNARVIKHANPSSEEIDHGVKQNREIKCKAGRELEPQSP